MILAFGIEVPFELFFFDGIDRLSLALNLLFPPLFMWATVRLMSLPSQEEAESLVNRTWYILENFDQLNQEEDVLIDPVKEKSHGLTYWIFSALYGLFFIGVFAAIFLVLDKIGYTLFSKLIFIFFLTVIAFFAYRVSQITQIYSWKGIGKRSSSVGVLALPILTIGSYFSVGLSKLNFLTFVFDFLLEAPFKLILGFIDDWFQFVAAKEKQVIE
jgi:hypothetical protein